MQPALYIFGMTTESPIFKSITEFTIKRSEWLHGEGGACSKLLRKKDQKKCCLGFECLARGCDPDLIEGLGTPDDLSDSSHYDEYWKAICDDYDARGEPGVSLPALQNSLININDDPKFDESVREARITELFAQRGVKVTFVD